jgi:glycosyltransferase involved in cell wall biosynthesis
MMKLGEVAVFSIPFDLSLSSELNNHSEPPPGVFLWSYAYPESINSKKSMWQKVKYWLNLYKHQITESIYTDSVAQKLERMLVEFKPDLVVIEELALYSYLSIVKQQGCKVIYDAHNVEGFLRTDISFPSKSLKSIISKNLQTYKIKSIERDFIQRSDEVWVCSNTDASMLCNLYKNDKFPTVHVIPNCIDVASYKAIRLGNFKLPSNLENYPFTLLFTATFSYRPNQVAAQLLIEQIFPLILQKYPTSRLILAGKDPSTLMLEATQQNPNIIVTGLVKDVSPYLAASSVVIVPLMQGSGTRLKILEAFACGRPVVSTSKGAEGLKVEDGKHLLIKDSIDDLVAGVIELWGNPDLAQKIAQNAYELVKAKYSWEVVGKDVERNLIELFYNLRFH